MCFFARSSSLCLLVGLIALPYVTRAAETGKVTRISYSAPSWNTDSSKIDDATVVLRDKITGKIVQIQLEETEPDSSKFSGQFSVNLGDQLAPEIYVPPQELKNTDRDNKKLHEMIQKGTLQRKPTAMVKDDKGQAIIGVYDTAAQAEAGAKLLEEELRLARELRRGKGKLPAAGLMANTAKQVADRVQMEAIEKAKALERERQSKALTEKERIERRKRAAELYAKGMVHFNKGDFKATEANLKEAVALDPESRDYYYTYGIALYRNDKFNEAAVALKLAKTAPAQETDRRYYLGLVHYRLKEYDTALGHFKFVGASSDKNLGPSATFYSGIVFYTQEKFEPAKKMFEKVIDTSSDPNLDKQSEDYLDRIAAALIFQKMRENKFTLSTTLGLMYDSNVLLSPDGSTSSATNISDARLVTVFDLQYRPIFSEKHEWSPHLTANLTNSSKNTAASADPFIYTLAAPYTYKGMLGKKSLRQTLTPGYELLYLDPYATGTKVREQVSMYLSSDTMLVMTPTWISTYTLEYRNDDSTDVASLGDGDMDAKKITFRTTQIKMLDKKTMLMPMLAYAVNAAKGKDKKYSRYDLGITYAAPFWNDSTWNAGLAYYNQKYPEATTKRTDSNYTLSAGFNKPVREWVSWGVTGTYTKNNSDISSNTYTKYMVMTNATFITNF